MISIQSSLFPVPDLTVKILEYSLNNFLNLLTVLVSIIRSLRQTNQYSSRPSYVHRSR